MAEPRSEPVTIELADLGGVRADVLVIPATTGGSFGDPWKALVKRFELPPIVSGGIRQGSIHVEEVPDGNYPRLVAFAATVDPEKRSSSSDVIRSIGRELGKLTVISPRASVIATPLLGTGVGRLSPRESLEGLVNGWLDTAAEGAQLRVVEIFSDRYELARTALGDIQSRLPTADSDSRRRPDIGGTDPRAPVPGAPTWNELAPDARDALSLAHLYRTASSSGAVHMEQLVVALWDAGDADLRALLGPADRSVLVDLAAAHGNEIPSHGGPARRMPVMPKLSRHASEAMVAARQLTGSEVVTASHIAQGAMATASCSFIAALKRHSADIQPQSEVPAEPVVRAVLMAEPSADTVPDMDATSSDRLNLGREVEMLASVMLARDTPLPLAVGLFGDWGSGKSFFMRMLHERLETISRLAAADHAETKPFCSHVRQIHFNAWHYVDGNLWASLAATIFDGLVDEANEDLKHEQQDQLGAAIGQAIAARHTRLEAEQALRTEQGRAGRFTTIAHSAIPAAVEALRGNPQLKHQLLSDQAAPVALSNSAEQFVAAVDAAVSFGQQSALLRELFRTELTKTRRRVTLIWAAVVCALFAGILALDQLTPWIKVLAAIPILLSTLTPALQGATRLFRAARHSRWLREKPLVDAQNRLADAELKERLATEEVAAREAELARLRDRGARLHDLVRAARTEYSAKLSMMSQLRKDFEQLTWLLLRTTDGNESSARRSEPPEALRQAVAKLCAEGSGRPADTLEVDRIVLYIDDLDRCSAKDVVRVLQAVNLLLTFKLFVVVIGVDGRWLESSLSSHYNKLLRSPVEYLEKIIQIPFVLRPMSPEAYAAMVEDLTSARLPTHRPGSDERNKGSVRPITTVDAGEPIGVASAHRNPADEQGTETPTTIQTGINEEGTPQLPRPESLVITDAERRLLGKVGSLITTPRTTKRLVNTYRMLRVCAGDDEAARFSPDGGGEYQAVVVLLAILLACPSQAKDIFDRIMDGDSSANVWDLVRGPENAGVVESTADGKSTTAARSGPKVNTPFDILRDLVDLTSADSYQRWIPLVSRFTYHLPSVVAPTPRSV